MKLTVLGEGSAFSQKYYNTMYILEADNGRRMAIDFGADAKWAYKEAGIGLQDIDAVYISHLHGDHIGGLEWLGFATYFNPTLSRPGLYLVNDLVSPLWNNALSAGMGSLQGKVCGLHDFFDVKSMIANEAVEWNGITLQPVQTIHIMNGFQFVPSYGLLVTQNGKTCFITCDTQHAPYQIQDFYNMADVIFQDCEYLYFDGKPLKSGVHAHYEDLKTLHDKTKAKMYLSHYQDGLRENETDESVQEAGFKGIAKMGMTVEF
jgi:ribonuclease BN (tRNA processing enzyme)